jgi:hypothetical protein
MRVRLKARVVSGFSKVMQGGLMYFGQPKHVMSYTLTLLQLWTQTHYALPLWPYPQVHCQ